MTGIIILAAGQSSRMGKPKQLLFYQGKSLVQHAIDAALATAFRPVLLVLGAFADEILLAIKADGVQVIQNFDWEEGMASSVRAAIKQMELQPEINQVLIILCDQPHVTAPLLNDMVQLKINTLKGIAACSYNDTMGVPVLFDRKYFAELHLLTGNDGAKKVLLAHADDVATIDFPLGSVDIDTVDDYQKLLSK